MADKPPPIDYRPKPITSEDRPEVLSEKPATTVPSKEGTLARILDRYNPAIFNRVIQNLKSFLVLKADRTHQLSAKKGEGEELTLFEKIFLARFEGNTDLWQKMEGGRSAKYSPKSEKAWAEFFQRLLPFAQEKRGNVSEIESLIYRGLLKQMGEKGTLISDLKFLSGQTDKFARLEIQGSQVLEQLASKMPGDVLAQALFASFLGGPEFAYLALSHRVVQPELLKSFRSEVAEGYRSPEREKETALREGTRQDRQGIALSARTEQLIAERLDLRSVRTESVVSGQEGMGKATAETGQLVSGLFRKKRKGTGGEGLDAGPVFVPWYQQILRFKKIPGKPRWWVGFIYFIAFSAVSLLLFYIFKFLLQ